MAGSIDQEGVHPNSEETFDRRHMRQLADGSNQYKIIDFSFM